MDQFFRDKFGPESGQWVRDHPELNKLAALYIRVKDLFNEQLPEAGA